MPDTAGELSSSSANPTVSIEWDGSAPVIIDQRRLPDALVRWRLDSVDDVVEAIRTLAVRGAPAIGIAGAYGIVLGLDEGGAENLGPDDMGALTELLDLLRELGGVSQEILHQPEILQRALTILRADFEVCDTYVYRSGAPLPCPITVFGGSSCFT